MKTNSTKPRTFRCLTAIAIAALAFFQTAVHAETLSYFTDPDNTTLQGWNNRVWDDTASAWVDLAPDVTAMPSTINGGVILPAAQGDENNGLFEGGRENGWLGGGRGVGPGGDGDKHANTLWLRSPLFVLDASGDLNVTLFGGYPKGTAPTSDAAIPSAATNEGGWMGVALRRVSDGAFLLTKTQPEPGSTVVTFTQAELQDYVGVSCTLDLINMDKGGWGWTGMNHVVIPGSVFIPTVDVGTSTVTASPMTVASDGVTASTVTVTVKDASGNPIAGKNVSLARTKGAGAGIPVITTLVGTSNASGVATFAVTCDTAGEYVFTATDESDSVVFLDDTVSITFATDAVSVLNSTVTASPPSIAADGSTTSTVTVTLKDATNSAVIGNTVTLAKNSGPGSPVIDPASATTNSSGVATFSVSSTTAGLDVFTATDTTDGITLGTAGVTFEAGLVNADQSTVVASPASVTANGTATSTITVTLKDAYGNPVAGKDVSLAKTSGPSSPGIDPALATTNASGVATFTVTSTTTAGDYVFTATVDSVPITATVTFTQPPATITWGQATDDTLNADGKAFVETDVKKDGTFVAAVTNGNGGTVNGVTFTGATSYNTDGTYLITYGASPITMQWAGNRGDAGWGSPSSAYGDFGYDNGTNNKLLLTGGGEGLSPGTITLSSLIVGKTYQVQIWAPTWNNEFGITVGGVNLRVSCPSWGPTHVSQYVVGTFTATGDTQPISWWGVAPSAISLLDVTVVGTTYTLSYAANGGTGSDPASGSVTAGTTVTTASNPYTRTGHTFSGWNTADDGSGTAAAAGDSFTMPASDTTLYAQWSLITHTLTYIEGSGGTITGTKVQTLNDGADGTEVTAVANAGYHFVKWSDNNSTVAARTDLAVTADITTTATFAKDTYADWATAHGFDPDHPEYVGKDGLTNLLVYALNLKTDGTNGSPGTLTGRTISFAKRAAAVANGDVAYAIENSPNLQPPWTTVTPDVDNGTTISYTLPSGAAGGKIFARLVVTQTP